MAETALPLESWVRWEKHLSLSQHSIRNVQTSEFRVDQTTATGSYMTDDQPGETWGESERYL